MERNGSGFEGDLEEYDPTAYAAEDAAAVKKVLESTDIDPEFQDRVRAYAEHRRRDLEASGNPEAAAYYDIAA